MMTNMLKEKVYVKFTWIKNNKTPPTPSSLNETDKQMQKWPVAVETKKWFRDVCKGYRKESLAG